MNFGDYDEYIAQKHRLAIALAVIKTKPDDKTIEEYTNHIKNEIIAEEMVTNVDVSLNENDFDISDDYMNNDAGNDDDIDPSQDSVTILKDFDENVLRNNTNANSLLDIMTQLSHIDENSTKEIVTTNTQNNITQSTFCDDSQNRENHSMNIINDPDDIMTFYESFNDGSNKQKELPENIYLIANNGTTFCETNIENDINEAINNVNKDINTQNSKIDSQQTEIYTLQGFTNNTYISQSQEDLVITNIHLLNKQVGSTNSVDDEKKCLNSIKQTSKSSIVEKNNFDFDKKSLSDKNKKLKTVADGHYSKTNCGKSYENDKQKSCVSSDLKTQIINNTSTSEYSKIELRRTADEYLAVFGENNNTFDNNKNISVQEKPSSNYDLNYATTYQSQDAQSYNLLSDHFETIFNSKRSTQTSEVRYPLEESLTHSLSYQNEHTTQPKYDINVSESIKNSAKDLINKQNNYIVDSMNFDESASDLIKPNKHNENVLELNSDSNVNGIQYKLKAGLNNSINLDPLNDEKHFRSIEHETERNFVSNTEMETEPIYIDLTKDETTESFPNLSGVSKDLRNNNRMLDEDIFSDNTTESQPEMVSFKILEELNKIKCYLNKRERQFSGGCSTDSGFRSSQPRSSYNGASQHSEGWINESAHSLLTYIKNCQPSRRTTDITDEISKILGKLVENLHEQEKYPKFLEELLETVDSLLTDVYEGNNEEFNKLIEKDEAVYRLLLLNRSTHIIKYTIEKILNILENILSDLSDIEITNTDRSENVCYIFHILEIILQRIKNTSSQSQQSSYEENILKKSSLTEIWRKKWNFTKIETSEGSSKRKCVLAKCSEVLNKVIVQAMDGYSLVSFAALQCFNLLQD